MAEFRSLQKHSNRGGKTFEYSEQLDEQHFRLLRLKRGEGRENIQCYLRSHSLKPGEELIPPYEALSYVWGTRDTTSKIECEGKDFYITPNLFTALQRLRLSDEDCILWIDQICINQDDMQERSAQVNIMRLIFSNAGSVIMWFGVDEGNQAALIEEFLQILCASGFPEFESDDFPTNEELQARGLPPRTAPHWGALESLTHLPYFSRIWIFQEVAVASDALVVWGNSCIPWRQLFLSLGWLFTCIRSKSIFGLDLGGRMAAYLALLREESDLLQLLWSTHDLQASEARDRIFALLGVAKTPKATLQPYQADYSKPLLTIHQEITRQIILSRDDLAVLSFIQHHDPRSVNDVPSWIFSTISRYPTPLAMGKSSRSATRHQNPELNGKAGDNVLLIKGLLVGKVKAVTTDSELISHTEPFQICEAWSLAEKCLEYVSEPHNLVTVFTRTLIADVIAESIYPLGDSTDADLLRDFACFLMRRFLFALKKGLQPMTLVEQYRELADRVIGAHLFLTQASFKPSASPTDDNAWLLERMPVYDPENSPDLLEAMTSSHLVFTVKGPWQKFLDAFVNATTKRRFFTTNEGKMGIGPMAIEAGDIVCVLFGGKTPYILRPMEMPGEYLFVGECYINDLMNGEAVDQMDRRERTPVWITLR